MCGECYNIIVQTYNHRKKFLKNARQLIVEGVKDKSGDKETCGENSITRETAAKKHEIEFIAPETKLVAVKREMFDCPETPTKTKAKRRRICDSDDDDEASSELKTERENGANKEAEKEIEAEKPIESEKQSEKSTKKSTEKPSPFICLSCSEVFKKSCTLRAHQFRVHGNDFKYLYQCSKCQNSFMAEKTLDYHVKIHEIDADSDQVFEDGDMDRERSCAECSQKFKTLDRLRKHWNLHHEKAGKSK